MSERKAIEAIIKSIKEKGPVIMTATQPTRKESSFPRIPDRNDDLNIVIIDYLDLIKP